MRVRTSSLCLQALPAWNLIRRAQRPVAINIEDCMQVPAIVAATNPRVRLWNLLVVSPLLLLNRQVQKPVSCVTIAVAGQKGTETDILAVANANCPERASQDCPCALQKALAGFCLCILS